MFILKKFCYGFPDGLGLEVVVPRPLRTGRQRGQAGLETRGPYLCAHSVRDARRDLGEPLAPAMPESELGFLPVEFGQASPKSLRSAVRGFFPVVGPGHQEGEDLLLHRKKRGLGPRGSGQRMAAGSALWTYRAKSSAKYR